MNSPNRIIAFLQRNRGVVLRNGVQTLKVRIWTRFSLWRIFGPFIRPVQPKTWVFMGGCYNSGTTILREMIGAHPEVSSLPREGVALTDAFPNLEADGWVRMWYRNAASVAKLYHDPSKAARLAQRDWSLWWRRGASVYLEKSIVHGAWMPALEQGFDHAKFIGVVRNGYCVCEGIRRRAMPKGIAKKILAQDRYSLTDVGKQWVFANEVLLRDQTNVQCYMQIRYEDFCASPLPTIQSIFSFLDINPAAATQQIDGTIVIGQRRFIVNNQNDNSLARLSAAEIVELNMVIGPMMDQLGYMKVEENV
jgi:hypothetical protein